MNTKLFKQYTTCAGFALMALMIISEFAEMGSGILYLTVLSASAFTIGAEIGKKTEWDIKEWWQYAMIALNTFFIIAFSIGFFLGVIGE